MFKARSRLGYLAGLARAVGRHDLGHLPGSAGGGHRAGGSKGAPSAAQVSRCLTQLRGHRSEARAVARLLSRPLPECLVALRHSDWDENRAVQWLLDQPDGVGQGSSHWQELRAFRRAARQDQAHPAQEAEARRLRAEALQLTGFLGRPEGECMVALKNSGKDVQRAAAWLMSNPSGALSRRDRGLAAELQAAVDALSAPPPPESSDDEDEAPAAGLTAAAGGGAGSAGSSEDCPLIAPGDRSVESTRAELDSVREDALCDHPTPAMRPFVSPAVTQGAVTAWARAARPTLRGLDVRDAGHGTGEGAAHVGQWMHAPDSSAKGGRARRFAWLPRRLRGGACVRLQAGHARMGRGSPEDREPVAVFRTRGDCSVFVLMPQAVAAQGFLPPWLEEQGFVLQPDCVVIASPGHDLPVAVSAAAAGAGGALDGTAQDVFLVFEAAQVGPRAGVPAEERHWFLGKCGTGIPRRSSHDDALGKASMYGVVVAPPSTCRLRKP